MSASTARTLRLQPPSALKDRLDRLYASFNYPDSASDPIQIVRRFGQPRDREAVGFIAASLAFGRVASVLQSIERVLAIMGPRPSEYLRRFEPTLERAAFASVGHRWTRGPDLVALLWVLRQMLDRSGSIEGFFQEGYDDGAEDVGSALDSFSREGAKRLIQGWRPSTAQRRNWSWKALPNALESPPATATTHGAWYLP